MTTGTFIWHALVLASATVAEPTVPAVVTPLDYFGHGRQQVDTFLDRSVELRGAADRSSGRCARVEIRHAFDEDGFRSVLGSGVLLGDGRHLLTAGHVVHGVEGGEIRVSFPSGEVLAASLLDHRYDAFGTENADWAILTLHGRTPDVRPLATSAMVEGGVMLMLGYPNHIGIDPQGDLVFGESETRFLEPIVTLGTASTAGPWILDPYVGAVPTEGMSGGPVFDAEGRLVGILVSVIRETGAKSRYHYRIVPVAGIPEIATMTSPRQRVATSHLDR